MSTYHILGSFGDGDIFMGLVGRPKHHHAIHQYTIPGEHFYYLDENTQCFDIIDVSAFHSALGTSDGML